MRFVTGFDADLEAAGVARFRGEVAVFADFGAGFFVATFYIFLS